MKFVSLSQLLGCPFFGSNSDLFTVPGFIVSLVGFFFLNKMEGRRDIKREEEGVEQKKKEWGEECVKEKLI